MLRTKDELEDAVGGNPFPERVGEGSRLLLLFLSGTPSEETRRQYDPVALAPGRIHIGSGAAYQWCPDGVLAAPAAGAFIERHWEIAVTARNWNTVTSLQRLLRSS